jgi:mono/diheme cytochrome c family protein
MWDEMRAFVLWSAACAAAMVAVTAAQPAHAQDIKTTFMVYCARCHGEGGQGYGADGASLAVRPRDFSNCALMSKIPDATIINAIKNGGASVVVSKDMPAWGEGLSDQQIHDLAAYVRSFCKK